MAAMAYTVLARRYRSTDFDEVVGQEPIARTLRAAIEAGQYASFAREKLARIDRHEHNEMVA